MKFSVVIVSFNTKELLRKCLESIESNRGALETEIIVVDNASNDGSVEMVKQRHKDIKILINKENFGFAKANNQGIKMAKGEYILLLNSDTEVKPGSLENLVEFAKKHLEAGVVGARLLNPDGSPQPSVYHFPTIWRAIAEYWLGQRGSYEKYSLTASDAVRVEAVTGAAMLILRKTIEKVGLLDERYFMYFEDLDYCRRVKRAGLKVYYLPQAEVIHYHGASGSSSGITYRYLVKSSKIYNGVVKYWFLFFIIWLGQKWQKILRF